ncbi:MAG: LysR family transcriptional regulator [Betaproteobacteria bacterium]|nr:LysR family transcriptional regulator [Betaproteobacteria bacterium]
MLITAESLHVVVTVAKSKSFAAAAKQLHRVPTAVSYTVHKLERSLGVQLFERRGATLALTEVGKYVLDRGELILDELEDLRFAATRIAAGFEAELRLSLNNIVSVMPLLALIRQSERLFPQTEIRVQIDVHNGVWDALLEKRADIAIGAPNQVINDAGLVFESMAQLSWDFAISPDHPLARAKEPLSSASLRKYPAVCVTDTSVRLEPKVAWRLRGQKALTAPDFLHKIYMQVAGLGIGFLPRQICRPYVERGQLVTRTVLEPKQDTPLFLAWRGEPQGKCFNWWLQALREPAMKASWTSLEL